MNADAWALESPLERALLPSAATLAVRVPVGASASNPGHIPPLVQHPGRVEFDLDPPH